MSEAQSEKKTTAEGSGEDTVVDRLVVAEQRVVERSANVEAVIKEKDNLKIFVVLAVVVPIPVYFAVDWKIAVFSAVSFLMFFAAGHYLNFMHVRNARQDRDAAIEEVKRLKVGR